ncbi:MAG: hypothetical protein ABDH59_07200 [Fervidobacterium sp.]
MNNITINRKFAVVFSVAFLVVTVAISAYYFYSSFFKYFTNFENLLSETTRSHNLMKQAEEEARFLETKRQEFMNSLILNKEGELVESEVRELIQKILNNKTVEINYLYLTAKVDYPILFEDTPVIYYISLKTGGE